MVPDGGGLRAARLDLDGALLDPEGIAITSSFRGGLTVTGGVPGFLITWMPTLHSVSARIVDVEGNLVSAETPIFSTSGGISRINPVWDGRSFSVIVGGSGRIFRTRVTGDGDAVDTRGQILVPASDEFVGDPDASLSAAGGILVAFVRQANLGDREINRIRLRRAVDDEDGISCSTDVACASGYCVDGVCCDQPCGGDDPGDCQACSVAMGAEGDGICTPLAAATVCRSTLGSCDIAEACDGTSVECPADQHEPNGSSCSNGDECTLNDSCQNGQCVSGEEVSCESAGLCRAGFCDSATGECMDVPLPDGTECDPDDLCFEGGACVAGECEPGPRRSCPPARPCQISEGCDPDSGGCTYAPKPDGTPCLAEEGDYVCVAGFCRAVPDAGIPDAGMPDAGAYDAGPAPDAALPDAAIPDAPDAGADVDAASPSARSSGGCRIGTGETNSSGLVLGLVLAGLIVTRRRRARFSFTGVTSTHGDGPGPDAGL